MRIVEIAPTLDIGCTSCGQRAVQVLIDEIADCNAKYVLAEIVESQCEIHAKIMETA